MSSITLPYLVLSLISIVGHRSCPNACSADEECWSNDREIGSAECWYGRYRNAIDERSRSSPNGTIDCIYRCGYWIHLPMASIDLIWTCQSEDPSWSGPVRYKNAWLRTGTPRLLRRAVSQERLVSFLNVGSDRRRYCPNSRSTHHVCIHWESIRTWTRSVPSKSKRRRWIKETDRSPIEPVEWSWSAHGCSEWWFPFRSMVHNDHSARNQCAWKPREYSPH